MRKIVLVISISAIFVSFGRSQTLNVPDNIGSSSNVGKVGIGTTSPENNFQIYKYSGSTPSGSDTKNGMLSLTGQYRTMAMGVESVSPYTGWIQVRHSSESYSTSFYNLALNPLGGKVGIGTTTPKTKLDVVGNSGIISFTGKTFLGLLVRGSNNSGSDLSGIDFTGYSSNYNEYPLARIAVRLKSNGSYLHFGTSNAYVNGITNTAMTIDNYGNVGIGTSEPGAKLEISDNNVNLNIIKLKNNAWACNQRTAIEFWNGYNKNYATSRIVSQMDGCGTKGEALIFETQTAGETNPSAKMIIKNNGRIGIGTTNPQSMLAVNGTITSTEVVVTTEGWSDFVFNKDYELKDLEEVESFIEENNHLPDIPSEKEVLENGIQVGEMNAKLLQKIEELTLYMIDLNKRVNSLEEENKVLKRENSILKIQ